MGNYSFNGYTKELEIIFKDDYLVAINKPHGLLVHRTRLSDERNFFALQMLRDQLDQQVFPVHRLDRKTSGVILFALDSGIHRLLQKRFAERKVEKQYIAIVRGHCDEIGCINYPLKKENGKLVEAITHYRTLYRTELNFPSGHHNTSRYSLVMVLPQTGRMHQIRRHFRHIHHPIIGDRPYGCNKQNKLFKEKFDMMTMLLHACQLSFCHPVSGKLITLDAQLQSEFSRMINTLKLKNPDSSKPGKCDGHITIGRI